jgi:hypothetical protein
MLRALIAALRRFFSRRAARRLLAQDLPRGIREQRLALPPSPREPPAGELWTAGGIGHRPSRLFRLAALPPPPLRLAVLEPRHFRLDGQFRSAPGLEPPSPRPSPRRPPRPRTPLPRAPLHRLDPGKFRLRPRTQALVNEDLVPLLPSEPRYSWLRAPFRRRFVDLPWMARDRVRFLGPLHAEWFLLWWDQSVKEKLGPREPQEVERPDEVDWAMDHCKEQMLIRRDVPKDENAPDASGLFAPDLGHPLVAWEAPALPELVPPKEWVDVADPRALLPPAPQVSRAPRQAYLRWRTLMDSLQDR